MEDEPLLRRAEEALTEIKVRHGLSEQHEAVLAALRIRLKGDAGASLDELLRAADSPSDTPDRPLTEGGEAPRRTLDDLLNEPPSPKPEWPS